MERGPGAGVVALGSRVNPSKARARVVGDPHECVDRLQQMKDAFGVTEFVLWSNLGGMPSVRAEHSIRLAWEKIAPHIS